MGLSGLHLEATLRTGYSLSFAKRHSDVDWLLSIGRHRMRSLRFARREVGQPT